MSADRQPGNVVSPDPPADAWFTATADEHAAAALLRQNYSKCEHRIAMRDGTRLFTAIYAPKDRSRRYPMLLLRTPFGIAPYGAGQFPTPANSQVRLAPLARYIADGYIFVYQDVRGRMMSDGDFVTMRPFIADKRGGEVDESSDAYDTVDWLQGAVEGHNGRVAVWGASYPGFYAAQAAIEAHPAIVAVSPQAPATEWFIGDDCHRHGAFCLADSFGFSASLTRTGRNAEQMAWGFDYGVDDLYDFFLRIGPLANIDPRYFQGRSALWNELMQHGERDDYWQARDPRPHYRNIRPAVLVVGGWFDEADLFGTLQTYRSMCAQSANPAIHLAMGPWRHGDWLGGGPASPQDMQTETVTAYRAGIEHRFFSHYLKGIGPPPPRVCVFETGGNRWRQPACWPPPAAQTMTLWFHAGQALRPHPPETGADDSDAYRSDPDDPVPCQARPWRGNDGSYMTADQRFAAARPDVVVYQTAVLCRDLVLAGPLEAVLWVAVSGSDADFVVKLIDVAPDDASALGGETAGGRQQLVRAEVMRGKFRHSYAAPEPFQPGEPTMLRIPLQDVAHRFLAGHRLMVQLQSSWFPLIDRNPQRFVDIYRAGAGDFQPATHRIYRSAARPSHLRLTLAEDCAAAIAG